MFNNSDKDLMEQWYAWDTYATPKQLDILTKVSQQTTHPIEFSEFTTKLEQLIFNLYKENYVAIIPQALCCIDNNPILSQALGEIGTDLPINFIQSLITSSSDYFLHDSTKFISGNFVVSLLKIHVNLTDEDNIFADNLRYGILQKILHNNNLNSPAKINQLASIMHYLNRWMLPGTDKPQLEIDLYKDLKEAIKTRSLDEPNLTAYANQLPLGVLTDSIKEKAADTVSNLIWGFTSKIGLVSKNSNNQIEAYSEELQPVLTRPKTPVNLNC